MYVGDIAGFVKNMGTTIYGMTAQYWKSVDFKQQSTFFDSSAKKGSGR
jgi:hypothetical protein